MRIKESISGIIGKIVSGIVVAKSDGDYPRSQIFFAFSDGTSFEFWGDQEGISMASGLDHQGMDQIVEILERREGTKIHTFRAPHEDPDAIQRDLLTKNKR